MINPTSLDLLALPSLPFSELIDIPPISGIYIVYTFNDLNSDGLLVFYVGKAVNLQKRWAHGHHRYQQLSEIDNAKIAWLECETEKLFGVEAYVIRSLKPIMNRMPLNESRNRTGANINDQLTAKIKTYAEKENRNFTQQVHVFLEEALENRKIAISFEEVLTHLEMLSTIELSEVVNLASQIQINKLKENHDELN
jgi:hypothetical protein